MNEHTELRIKHCSIPTQCIVVDTLTDGKEFSLQMPIERAEYIVRACNCHDDMLKMLKYLKSALLLMEQYEALPVPGILRENIKRTGFIIAKATT